METDSRKYTFKDIWNAILTEHSFNYEFWLEIAMQIIFTNIVSIGGRFLVVFTICLITYLGYVGIFISLPVVCSNGSFFSLVHIFNGVFFLFNIFFNYILAVLTNPGNPKSGGNMTDSEINDFFEEKTCKKCNSIKPPRTHHCSVCKKCIIKMDHHCPYISNCVGYYNYRYFFCFLLWTFLGTAYLTAMSGWAIYNKSYVIIETNNKFEVLLQHKISARNREKKDRFFNPQHDKINASTPYKEVFNKLTRRQSSTYLRSVPDNKMIISSSLSGDSIFKRINFILEESSDADLIHILISCVISASVCLAVGALFFFHVALVRSGQTTLEYYGSWSVQEKLTSNGRIYKGPYDKGINKNFAQVFGHYVWYRAILPSFRLPPPLVYPNSYSQLADV